MEGQQPARDERGYWRKGHSGNAGSKGRVPGVYSLAKTIRSTVDREQLVQRVCELAMSRSPAFLPAGADPATTCVQLDVDPRTSMAACKWLADYGYTKEPQQVSVTTTVVQAAPDAPLTEDERAEIRRLLEDEERAAADARREAALAEREGAALH